jgi:hypothetical protein
LNIFILNLNYIQIGQNKKKLFDEFSNLKIWNLV